MPQVPPSRIFVLTFIIVALAAIAFGGRIADPLPEAELSAPAEPFTVVPVVLPIAAASPGSVITVPMTTGDLSGLGVTAYQLQITYDPAVVQPASPFFDKAGTLSSSLNVTGNPSFTGHLLIAGFGTFPIGGSGTLLNLKFTVVGTYGQSTPLTFENWTDPGIGGGNHFHVGFMYNESVPGNVTTNGRVMIPPTRLSGTVTYGNAIGGVTPRFVSNVLLSGAGSVPVSVLTDPTGAYLLTGFGAGSYTVTPSKPAGPNNGSISSFDAGLIALHVAGPPLPHLGGNQLIVADVSGNGTISSFDAGKIALYVVTIPTSGSTGHWIFGPVDRTYQSMTSDLIGEDYSALLMGEVSGNWTDTGARPANQPGGPERSAAVAAPNLIAESEKEVIVPITVEGAANKGIISYEFNLSYDPKVLQPEANPVDLARTVSRGLIAVANAREPGLLRVVVYGPMAIDDNGALLNLRFTAVGAPGSASPLTWERIMFNEGDPGVTATDGRVELSAAVPNTATEDR